MNMDRKKKNAMTAVTAISAYVLINIAILVLTFIFLPPFLLRFQGDIYFSAGEFEEAEAIYTQLKDEGLRESRLIAIEGMKEIRRDDYTYGNNEKPLEDGVAYLLENGFTVEILYENKDGELIESDSSRFSDVYAPGDSKTFKEHLYPIAVRDGGYLICGWDRSGQYFEDERHIVIRYSPVWVEQGYRIIYVGVDPADNPNPKDYIEDEKITLKPPSGASAEGFIGWYSDPEFTREIKEIERGSHVVAVYARYEGEPVPIYSVEDLRGMSPFGNYILMADLNWNNAGVSFWDPPFCGMFDGNGHTVTSSNAMFGRNDGYVSNLKVISDFAAVSDVNNGVISNCDVEVFINSNYEYVGGVVGENYGIITDCSARGRISGSAKNVGGVAGYNFGIIERCASDIDVVSSCNNFGQAGGFVGYNYGCIFDSYSIGDVSAALSNCGGFVGLNNGVIERCYSSGDVKSTTKKGTGGFVGDHTSYFYYYLYPVGYIKDCFALGDVNGGCVGGFLGVPRYQEEINHDFIMSFGNIHRTEITHSKPVNALGEVQSDETMRSVAFQRDVIGLDERVWRMSDGELPTLIGVGE